MTPLHLLDYTCSIRISMMTLDGAILIHDIFVSMPGRRTSLGIDADPAHI